MPIQSQELKQQNIFTENVDECRLSSHKSEQNQFSSKRYQQFLSNLLHTQYMIPPFSMFGGSANQWLSCYSHEIITHMLIDDMMKKLADLHRWQISLQIAKRKDIGGK